MKKYISGFLLMILPLILCGCSSSAKTSEIEASSTVEAAEAGQTDKNDKAAETVEATKASETVETSKTAETQSQPVAEPASSSSGVDLDLTLLSSTMVYSEVYNIMYYPDEYIGKIIRMKGIFSVYHDEATDYNYYACIISDATACCQSGIEFILMGDPAYPDAYPLEGTEITVTGEFQIYYEGETMYCHLIDATLS